MCHWKERSWSIFRQLLRPLLVYDTPSQRKLLIQVELHVWVVWNQFSSLLVALNCCMLSKRGIQEHCLESDFWTKVSTIGESTTSLKRSFQMADCSPCEINFPSVSSQNLPRSNLYPSHLIFSV